MKVVRYHEFGDESVLKYEDVPDPEPGPGEVLINVTAASVNRGEVTRRKGTRAVEAAFPIQPGWDTAGTVAGLGSGVSDLAIGQRVVGWLATGGYAERVVATRTDVVPTPDNVSDDEAASVPTTYLTAWVALIDTAQLKAGEMVLVQAASSGVGVAGIQIAKHVVGAEVLTTTSSAEKAAKAMAIGAAHVINYLEQDFVAEVMRLTNGAGVNVILDSVGGSVYEKGLHALAEGGRLVPVGFTEGRISEPDPALVASRNLTVFNGWGRNNFKSREEQAQGALAELLQLMSQDKFRPLIDKVFPLSEAGAAHRYLDSRQQFGKVILKP